MNKNYQIIKAAGFHIIRENNFVQLCSCTPNDRVPCDSEFATYGDKLFKYQTNFFVNENFDLYASTIEEGHSLDKILKKLIFSNPKTFALYESRELEKLMMKAEETPKTQRGRL